MKSNNLQMLVKRIFSDNKTRQQFIANPESVISRFELTDQEKRAVLDTHAGMGLVSGNSAQLEAVIRPTSGWFAPAE
ncbi:MAG: hypothetical protein JXA46_11845 [Dehalococcoidales bacterium]|nr:hypothetical protein [Dehalococcoidales bacterium]